MQELSGAVQILLRSQQHQGVPRLQAQAGIGAVDGPLVADDADDGGTSAAAKGEFGQAPAEAGGVGRDRLEFDPSPLEDREIASQVGGDLLDVAELLIVLAAQGRQQLQNPSLAEAEAAQQHRRQLQARLEFVRNHLVGAERGEVVEFPDEPRSGEDVESGMVLAGGCGVGTIWRVGEGQVKLWAALATFALGASLTRLALTASGLSGHLGVAVFLPAVLGWGGAVALVVAVMVAWAATATWNEDSRRFIVLD